MTRDVEFRNSCFEEKPFKQLEWIQSKPFVLFEIRGEKMKSLNYGCFLSKWEGIDVQALIPLQL